ncbi:MAG TPA: MoaD family protein [Gemmatales bacterium]|nr:MoaD family protein [Gemmatales bacterium]HMP60466.1 MoaD family protein [Gemmatales bacterium]
MAVTIHIPAPLREHTNQQERVAVEGGTVAAVLEDLSRQFPALRERVFEPSGQVRRFVNIYLNDEDVRYLEHLATPVAAGDQVAIIPAVAGG